MTELWPENPRLAAVYDTENAARHDHDLYLDLADRVGARAVVDVGCGTGVFAVDLARRGLEVIGVDPAQPMLDIAERRSTDLDIGWIRGRAADVPSGSADLAVMMGHVAQYFVDDDEWSDTLGELHRIVRPDGRLAFETRNPLIDWAARWTRERTIGTYPHPDGGEFTSWVEVVARSGSASSYQMTHEGHTLLPDGQHLVSSETLRFRSEAEVRQSIAEAGFEIERLWGDWDRSAVTPTSLELIVVAKRR